MKIDLTICGNAYGKPLYSPKNVFISPGGVKNKLKPLWGKQLRNQHTEKIRDLGWDIKILTGH
ncbi:MAG: hypothetical protein MGG11_12745 [Trichodesmium sp. MAG_R03]|nr:hypothetical protein [Trichodesmium sp. MAG_R03]